MLTAKEMAEQYRVTPKTFLRWVKEKNIPSHRVGRKYLFDPKVVAPILLDKFVEPQPRPDRWFKVTGHPDVGFGFDLHDSVLRYIRDLPELGQYLFQQPACDANGLKMAEGGTVSIDYNQVEEVTP